VKNQLLAQLRGHTRSGGRAAAAWSIASALLCVMLAGSFLLGQPLAGVASAASRTVGCGNTASLISAINDANATPEPDTIALTAGCTYQLAAKHNDDDGGNGLPSITSPITIAGNGAKIVRTSTTATQHSGSSASLPRAT